MRRLGYPKESQIVEAEKGVTQISEPNGGKPTPPVELTHITDR